MRTQGRQFGPGGNSAVKQPLGTHRIQCATNPLSTIHRCLLHLKLAAGTCGIQVDDRVRYQGESLTHLLASVLTQQMHDAAIEHLQLGQRAEKARAVKSMQRSLRQTLHTVNAVQFRQASGRSSSCRNRSHRLGLFRSGALAG